MSEQLQSENARLRKALEMLYVVLDIPAGSVRDCEALAVARAALGVPKPDHE
jgi:hypothetical protein